MSAITIIREVQGHAGTVKVKMVAVPKSKGMPAKTAFFVGIPNSRFESNASDSVMWLEAVSEEFFADFSYDTCDDYVTWESEGIDKNDVLKAFFGDLFVAE